MNQLIRSLLGDTLPRQIRMTSTKIKEKKKRSYWGHSVVSGHSYGNFILTIASLVVVCIMPRHHLYFHLRD